MASIGAVYREKTEEIRMIEAGLKTLEVDISELIEVMKREESLSDSNVLRLKIKKMELLLKSIRKVRYLIITDKFDELLRRAKALALILAVLFAVKAGKSNFLDEGNILSTIRDAIKSDINSGNITFLVFKVLVFIYTAIAVTRRLIKTYSEFKAANKKDQTFVASNLNSFLKFSILLTKVSVRKPEGYDFTNEINILKKEIHSKLPTFAR